MVKMEQNVKKRKVNERRRQKLEKFTQEYCELQEKKAKLESEFICSNSDASDTEYKKFDSSIIATEYSFDECSESEEEEAMIIQPKIQEIKDIKAWVVDNSIPHKCVDKLLRILKRRLLPQIPMSTKTLLKSDVGLENMEKTVVSDGSTGKQNASRTLINAENNVEVMEMETIECKTDFEFFVMKSLAALSKDVADIKAKQEIDIADIKKTQDEIVSFLLDKKVIKMTEASIDFTKKYQYSFPLSSIERFFEFDKDLENNIFLRNDVIEQLGDLFDTDLIITKTLVRMLRFFITKEVAEKFTAVRKSRTQTDEKVHRFISTTLYSIICGVIKFKRNSKEMETNDKMLLKGISDVLCNIKNWN